MITYTRQQYGYCEIVGLSTDKKPIVDNGSLFTEMETGKQFRFNAETKLWIEVGRKYPVSLSESDGKYKVVFSDCSEESAEPVIEGDKAVYIENGVRVSCAITVPKKKGKKNVS